jgi:nicotinamide mononucleotide (NMN) deamidase PncC
LFGKIKDTNMLHKEPALAGRTLPSIYLTITGGGTGIIPKLLEQGGASNYFVGAQVPYGQDQTESIFYDMLDEENFPKVVSKECAKVLAEYSSFQAELGIGVTCSLMKAEGEREGRVNEAYVCFNLSGDEHHYHWTFSKESYIEETDSLMGGYEVKVTRKYQEEQLVNKLYKALVEILSK